MLRWQYNKESEMTIVTRFVEAGFDSNGESAILDKRDIDAIHPVPGLESFSISNLYYVEDGNITTKTEHVAKPYDINLPPQATRFLICRIPPIKSLLAELNNPEVQTDMDFVNKLGMHRTPSVDYFYIVKGAVKLFMGNGDTFEFKAGDAYAMRGADHAWVNYGDETCELVGIMLGVAE